MRAQLRWIILFALISLAARPAIQAAPADSAARPAADDVFWDDQFVPPGVGGSSIGGSLVHEADIGPDGQLYVAGSFNQAGGRPANSVARWDGYRWHALGAGMVRHTNSTARVEDLVWWRGELYAAGLFDQAGGAPAYGMARWDGSRWSHIGSGQIDEAPYGIIYAMAVYNDELYLAGRFSGAGAIDTPNIIRWDGSRWAAAGGGVGGPSGTLIETMAVHNNQLYVGGVFTRTGSLAAHNLARWDGGQWAAVGSAASQPGDKIETLLSAGGQLYAGGVFQGLGGSDARAVARWDGARWHGFGPADPAAPARVSALTQRQGRLYAGSAGGGPILAWDGTSWQQAGPSGPPVHDFAQTAQTLYVGGAFLLMRRSGHPLISTLSGGAARLEGGRLEPLGNAQPEAEADSQRSLVVAGGSAYIVTERNLLIWDRLRWQTVPLPAGRIGCVYYSCVAVTGAGVHVVVRDSLGDIGRRIISWSGGAWQEIGVAEGGIGPLLALDDRLYAGGSFTTIGGVAAGGVAEWDGSRWRAVAATLRNGGNSGIVHSLAAFNGRLIAGGSFTEIDGVAARHIARWDGPGWASIGAPANTTETARMAAGADELFIFDAMTGIHRWDGQSWSFVGQVFANAMAIHRGQLVVGGRFGPLTGGAADHLARWDGSAWRPLGSGVNAEVHGLAASGNDLFVAGRFTEAGGKLALSFTRWNPVRLSTYLPWAAR